MTAERWKRGIAISCTHAEMLHDSAKPALAKALRDWKPDAVLHLGDFLDTTAFRSNADDIDASKEIRFDLDAGIGFLDWYFAQATQATTRIVFEGNHDMRPRKLAQHPNAHIRHSAQDVCAAIASCVSRNHALYINYDIKTGWYRLGRLWGHGFMIGENAVRDHAEMMGEDCAIGHLHRVEKRSGRSIKRPTCDCIGWLGDESKAYYARHRRATMAWGLGFALFEWRGNDSILHVQEPTRKGEWRIYAR